MGYSPWGRKELDMHTRPVPLLRSVPLHLAGLGGEGHIDVRRPRFVSVFGKDSSTSKVSITLSFLLFFFSSGCSEDLTLGGDVAFLQSW